MLETEVGPQSCAGTWCRGPLQSWSYILIFKPPTFQPAPPSPLTPPCPAPKVTTSGCSSIYIWKLCFSFHSLGLCILSRFSCIRLFVTPWTIAHQAPLSMAFSKQEYWSGLPFLPQEIFPTQGSNWGLLYCWQILYLLSHQGRTDMYRNVYLEFRALFSEVS